MGQRVHAKCAAGADVDRLERVVLQRCLGGGRSCLRAKVDIKRRTRLSRSGRRTVGGRGVPCRSSVGGISGWRGVTRDSRRAGRRLRNRGRGLCRLGRGCGLRHGLLYRLCGLHRDAPGICDNIVGRVVRTVVRHRSGQVFNGLFLRPLGKQLGVVGSFFLGTLLPRLLKFLILPLSKQHNVGRGDGKEEHQPQQEYQQHNDIGRRATEQRQQRAADRGTPDAALPEIGLATGKQHLNHLPGVGVVERYVREDHRHTGAQHAHQHDFTRKQRDTVAGRQQIREVQQKRPDQIGHDAENAKKPAAQGLPHILAGHQHHGNTQQT